MIGICRVQGSFLYLFRYGIPYTCMEKDPFGLPMVMSARWGGVEAGQ